MQSQLEEALRISEERFRGTFENAPAGIAHEDAECRFLLVNEKLCAILGYTRAELLQKTYLDITHPDDLAASKESFTALLRGDWANYVLAKRYVRKDGSPVWAEFFASLQRDSAGAPAYVIAVIRDLSERKRLETTFQELRAHLGLQTTRGWCAQTVLRAAPCLFGLYTAVALLYHALPQEQRVGAVRWPGKGSVTFWEALSAVRRWLGSAAVFPQAGNDAAIEKLPEPLREIILSALAPAA